MSYADLKSKRSAYGKLLSRKFVFSEYLTSLEDGKYKGTFVIHKFESDFENNKSVSEFVTTKLDDDSQWRILGYAPK